MIKGQVITEVFYKNGYTYVRVYDNLEWKQAKLKGMLLTLAYSVKLGRVESELRKELKNEQN